MLNQNICNFIPDQTEAGTVHTIHFVLETKPQNGAVSMNTICQVCYVLEGSAVLTAENARCTVSAGDVFFRFPARSYGLLSEEGFRYLYIGFMGSYAQKIMETFRIDARNYLFRGYPELADFWVSAVAAGSELAAVNSLSVLLYTLSSIGIRTSRKETDIQENADTSPVSRIIQYIDGNYRNPALTVRYLAKELSYHEKYISSLFRRHTGIRIREYITAVRIQQAQLLISQGFSSVSDIAYLCGFSDPLYFSKVYKQKTGVTPQDSVRSRKEQSRAGSSDGAQISSSMPS